MAYTVKEFVEMDLKRKPAAPEPCPPDCERSCCYYDRLSEVIEKHPIGLPGVVRHSGKGR